MRQNCICCSAIADGASPASELTSSFRASYNLAVNLVRRYAKDQAYEVLDRSFAQFVSTDHHHALSRRMDRALRLLERRGHVDLDAWRLTASGNLVAHIYHESDLLVAEAFAHFDCRQILLPDMHPVGAHLACDVRTIVDDQ